MLLKFSFNFVCLIILVAVVGLRSLNNGDGIMSEKCGYTDSQSCR